MTLPTKDNLCISSGDSSFLPSEEAFVTWQMDVQDTQGWTSKSEFALMSLTLFLSAAIHPSILKILLDLELYFVIEIYGIYLKCLFFNALCYVCTDLRL